MFKRPTTLLLILLYGMSLAFVIEIRSAKAEPYLALRTGFKCSQCHVNRTGGGKRTEFGLTYSQTHLYMKLLGSKEEPVLFDSKLNRSISVGANFRAENISLLRYENV
ncbi:MAG: hypothetical protein ACE5IR_25545, partial [bacterium]